MRVFRPTIPLCLIAAFVAADGTAAGLQVRADLRSTEEVPALSTSAEGTFLGTFSVSREELDYELSYGDLEGEVAQAHLHLGQRGVSGGISIFLCTNLGNGPPGTQLCPPSPATISGTLSEADVLGPTNQGIGPGEWDEVRRAIEEDVVYVNVHTDLFPAGELRGQVRGDQGRNLP